MLLLTLLQAHRTALLATATCLSLSLVILLAWLVGTNNRQRVHRMGLLIFLLAVMTLICACLMVWVDSTLVPQAPAMRSSTSS